MNRSDTFIAVKLGAKEYAFHYAWAKREKKKNMCLAIAKTWLEIWMAIYRVNRKRAIR